ncbi:DUF1491 family protein [Saccharibacter sp. 17.LH.SD]|uniref:DUF1491 family protein n=1 Tax=Saccharibacter sp. 17.LH.SD TaxID=2689393 RepID=UPI0013689EF1|nr:DUF1491 family protein [Saccharibacter sp. 17.LH.SD]MXV43833.1 DUF1491 family protein [Saccharibacter sp. 17.LH.SD]
MSLSLKSGFWIRALLRRFDQNGDSAMIVHKGNDDAGSIFIILRDRSNNMVVLQEYGSSWRRHHFDTNDDETRPIEEQVDTYLQRQKKYDPDLWIIELGVRDISRPLEYSLGSRKEIDKMPLT